MTKGRVTEAHRTNFTVTVEGREYIATVRGVFHEEGDFPKVGDYVTISLLADEKAVIEEVLPRKSVIKRKAADTDEEQIIASNVDIIFIVMGLDGDFNTSRLERYLLLAQQSGVTPVVILNKSDVPDDVQSLVDLVTPLLSQTKLHVVSATNGDNMAEIKRYFTPDTTAVLLGSSGAGKSTITNWLLNTDAQLVKDIRQGDSRGRHTTTSRQLFALSEGGYLIDTPGMRELGVLESDSDDEMIVFERIENLSNACQFSNCDHEKSQGCAVLAGLESGEITDRELQNYHKIIREREFQESKDTSNSARHFKQNKKRQNQQYAEVVKQKLGRNRR